MPSSTPSSSTSDRLRLSRFILHSGEPAERPCVRCDRLIEEGKLKHCVVKLVMPGEKRLKCAECTRRGRACVDMDWDTVERLAREAKEDVVAEEREREELIRRLSDLQARLGRKRKVLELAQRRANDQAMCLVREMEANGEEMTRRTADDVLAASAIGAELFPDG